jgi:hypothetical protein
MVSHLLVHPRKGFAMPAASSSAPISCRGSAGRRVERARAVRPLVLLIGLSFAFPVLGEPARPNTEDVPAATQYVQKIIGGMVAVSQQTTRERRAFYENLLANEIDWSEAAVRALGPRSAMLDPADRRKLADWARDAVLGEDVVMDFVQNLIFHACAITSRNPEEKGVAIRISCSVFGNVPNFSARLFVARRGERFQIADVGYIEISLMEELGDALFDRDAVAKHGVRVEGVSVRK